MDGGFSMRTILLSAAALLASGGAALAAPEVEIEDAVARVTVVPENRPDVAVEVQQGSAGLPAVTVERRGGKTFIDGHVKSRDIRSCMARRGESPVIDVDGVGRVALDAAPRIIIRTPMDVDVEADGAVFGNIGRSGRVELSNAGCGDWQVANTIGALKLSVAGSGDTRAGTARSAEVRIAGSGDVTLVAVRDGLKVAVAGSGDVRAGRVDGPFEASVAGSGDVIVEGGQAREAKVRIAGSGDVRFQGAAASLSASVAGSGDVRFQRVSGPVSRSIIGSGDIRVGD
jgi:hypothetical protein